MTTPYLTLTGYTGGDSLPVIPRQDYDEAFGKVPGWLMLFDPDDVKGDAGAWNRAQESTDADADAALAVLDSNPDYGITVGAFSGGQSAFNPTDGDYLSFNPDLAFPSSAWSFFGVATPLTRTSSSNNFLTAKTSITDPELSPRIGFSGDGTQFGLYANKQNAQTNEFRVSHTPAANYLGRVALLMVTFSTRDGLRIYEDGALVATNAADKAPFTAGEAAGEWNVLSYGRGKFGVMGLLSVDLGWSEHAGYRRLIEQAMITKYGIT